MIDLATLLNTARTWAGTPYQAHQATKGVGCDCIGFLWGLTQELDIHPQPHSTMPHYSPQHHLHNTRSLLLEYLRAYEAMGLRQVQTLEPGAVVAIWNVHTQAHMGLIMAQGTFMHALWTPPRLVREVRLTPAWERAITHIYRLPRVIYPPLAAEMKAE